MNAGVERFRSALPEADLEVVEEGIHDLVSFAPTRVAESIGDFLAAQPP